MRALLTQLFQCKASASLPSSLYATLRVKVGAFASAVSCVMLLLSCASAAIAADRYNSYHGADGSVTFSDAPIKNGQVDRTSYSTKVRLKPARNPCRGLSNRDLDARAKRLKPKFIRASEITGVDVSLLMAVARAESCFDRKAKSHAGAIGLMQLMPPTAKAMGVANIYSAWQNMAGGASYLALLLKRYSNDLDLALAAYNAGPGNVSRYNGVPPFRETRRYIVSVKGFQERYRVMIGRQTQVATSED